MFYDRKIKYLDYYEDGVRVRGGGFVKLEARGTDLRVEVVVSGLYPNDSFTRDVVFRSRKKESVVGKIAIKNGRGQYRQLCQDLKDIEGTGIGYDELQGVYILLGTGREVSCSWPARELATEEGSQRNKVDVGRSASHRNGMNETKGESRRNKVDEAEGENRRSGTDSSERRNSGNRTDALGRENSGYGMNETEGESRRSETDSSERRNSGNRTDALGRENSGYGMNETEGESRRSETDALERGNSGNRTDALERGNSGAGMNETEGESRKKGTDALERENSGNRTDELESGNSRRRTDALERGNSGNRTDALGRENSGYGMNETEGESRRRESDALERGNSRNWMDTLGRRNSGNRTDALGRENSGDGMNETEGENGRREVDAEKQGSDRNAMNIDEGNDYRDRMNAEKVESNQRGMGRREGEVRQGGMGTMNRSEHKRTISDMTASANDWRDNGKGGQNAVNSQRENEVKRNNHLNTGQESLENGRGERTGIQKAEAGKTVRLLEDKWMQLCAIYPHIRPFRDKREYLSIGPADFVLFPATSYKLVNNSFLLHGYYNYHHLILTRLEQRGEYRYYIGVPGTYFEKEKQVAIMFGFESFECETEPAQIGDFGYYMMRTEL